jgi:hypothetical protein
MDSTLNHKRKFPPINRAMGTITIDVIRQLMNVIGGAEAMDVAMALHELEEVPSELASEHGSVKRANY